MRSCLDETLRWALHEKQRLLAEAGVNGYCSTQMCFDPDAIAKWLRVEREMGLTLPVHLGISGVVDKAKLLTMGARLGIGDSLKYLRKNVGAVVKMMTTISYDPNDLLLPLSSDLLDLGSDRHACLHLQPGRGHRYVARISAQLVNPSAIASKKPSARSAFGYRFISRWNAGPWSDSTRWVISCRIT